jgi:hypothetical protein
MLYRLFAPLFVVVLVIGGVGLSSELTKNSKSTQSATSIAYAGACPESSIPINDQMCKARNPLTGQIIPNPCYADTPRSGRIDGVCVEWQGTGCCMANSWLDEQSSIKLQLKDLLGDNFLSDAIKGLIGSIGGGGGGGYTGPTGLERPRCTSISKNPTLPLRPGDTAILSWVASGGWAQSTTVTPGVGIVRGTTAEVSPSVSTTYTVTLRNTAGEAKCPDIRVHVGPRDVVDDNVDDNISTPPADDDYSIDIWSDDDAGEFVGTTNYDFIDNYVPDTDGTQGVIDNTEDIDDQAGQGMPTYNYTPPSTTSTDEQYSDSFEDTDISVSDWYDYRDDYLYRDSAQVNKRIREDSSGLTDEEIYGIWSRPQSPATGGIGLSGGYIGGDDVDTSGGQTPGIFSRIGSWIKGLLCPWCKSDIGAQMTPSILTASANIAVTSIGSTPQPATCTTGGADTGVFVDPYIVQRESCSSDMTEQECNESWAGKRVNVSWGVECGSVCALTTQDAVLRDRLTQSGSLEGLVLDDTEFTLGCVNALDESNVYSTNVRVIK